jgi:predicted enzyme related to lactoylglutathione lyase
MANRQLKAKLVICSVPTKNSATARKFYDTLLGGEDFARSLNDRIESYYRPISQDGLTLSIAGRQNDREPITCWFAVDNLDETVRQLEAAGGKVVVKSTPMPISGPPEAKKFFEDAVRSRGEQPSQSAGHFATMLDPDENYVGLMQVEGPTKTLLKAEPAHRTLSAEQVAEHDNWKQHGEPLMKSTAP